MVEQKPTRKSIRKKISKVYLDVVGEPNIDSVEYLTNLLYKYRDAEIYDFSPFGLYCDATLEKNNLEERMKLFKAAAEQSTLKGSYFNETEYVTMGIVSYTHLLSDYAHNYKKPYKGRKIKYFNTRIKNFHNEFNALSEYFFSKDEESLEQEKNFLEFDFGETLVRTNDIFCMDRMMKILEKYTGGNNEYVDDLKNLIEQCKLKYDSDYSKKFIEDILKNDKTQVELQNEFLDMYKEYKKKPSKELHKKIMSRALTLSFDKNKLENKLKNVKRKRTGKGKKD